MDQNLIRHIDRQKALDHAVWLNFFYRTQTKRYGVIQSIHGDYFVVYTDHPSFEGETFETLPNDYTEMSFQEIEKIGMDEAPHDHWETIKGMVSVLHGEILRFLIAMKVPLERFIRWELACRGFDTNHKWVGFEKASEIWLK